MRRSSGGSSRSWWKSRPSTIPSRSCAGLKEKYEIHHGLRIADEAIIEAVNLSARYITDRFLPDKAVDLIDEAAASRRLDSESLPKEIDVIRREITRLEVEHQALTKEGDKAKARIAEIDGELAKLKEQNDELSAKWHTEKIKFETLHQLRQKVDNLKQEAVTAERDGNLERVAEITYGELPRAEKDFQVFEKKNFGTGAREREARQRRLPTTRFLKDAVDKEDVAAIVSVWTGIPLAADARIGYRKNDEDRRRAPRPRGGPGRSDHGRRVILAPRARRTFRREPADRIIHVPWADRRRKDRARPRARRIHVQR